MSLDRLVPIYIHEDCGYHVSFSVMKASNMNFRFLVNCSFKSLANKCMQFVSCRIEYDKYVCVHFSQFT